MNRQQLIEQIHAKKSFLCVGLDPDMDKLPACLKGESDPVFAFNRAIIDATLPYAVAYKPNTAFYEAYGLKGLTSLQKTIDYLRNKNVFTIADAKRGDIGNTSARYAKAFLSEEGGFNFDAITVAPYMGSDSVQPFLQEKDKWVILLALTSNAGSADFQTAQDCPKPLYQKVLEVSKQWGTPQNMMYVVGATKADMLEEIRRIVPEHFLLVPGVGAQGGSLEEVCQKGLVKNDIGLLINASRSILYASKEADFAAAAAQEAARMQQQMSLYV
ncbi:MAG: orotidine-5'-phosphate decarboxylase [Lentimicrobiaceae bacterium]|nr:orotidine-5'-phosphate decarboxylase [Lentimicrobiaceae bacterium]